MNIWDVLIIAVITVPVVLFLVRPKKRGGCCHGNCSCCAGCPAKKNGSEEA